MQKDQIAILIGEQHKTIYQVKQIIGSGGFGKVYLAFENFDQSCPVAIKTFKNIKQNPKQMLHEVECIRNSTKNSQYHHNIIGFIDFASTIDKNQQFKDCFVMQFCQSTLYDQMDHRNLNQKETNTKTFAFQEIIFLATQIARAICAIHEKGLFHRDIKPANILLKQYHFIIGDFGIAKKLQQSQGTCAGTYYYMAPETFYKQKYDTKCDIWSIGMTLATIFSNARIMDKKKLDTTKSAKQQFKKFLDKFQPTKTQIKKKLKKGYSQRQIEYLFAIIDKTIVIDPTKRDTAKDLLQYLQSIPKKFPEKKFELKKYKITQSFTNIIQKVKNPKKAHKFQYFWPSKLQQSTLEQSKFQALLWSSKFLKNIYASIIELKKNILMKSSPSQQKYRILYLTFLVSKIFDIEISQVVHIFEDLRKECRNKYRKELQEIKQKSYQLIYYQGKCQSQHCVQLIKEQSNKQAKQFQQLINNFRNKMKEVSNKQKKYQFSNQLLRKMEQSFPRYHSQSDQQKVIRAFRPLFAVFAMKQQIIRENSQIIIKDLKCFVNCVYCNQKAHNNQKPNDLCRIVGWITKILQKYCEHKKLDNKISKKLQIMQKASKIIMNAP